MPRNKLKLVSLNARGLGEKKKRRTVLKWIKDNHSKRDGIVFLQETHTTELSEQTWKRDWDGEVFFSHGTCGSRGVAILIPKSVHVTVSDTICDNSGRLLVLDCTIDDEDFILANVYAPTKDHQHDQITFLQDIDELLRNYVDRNLIIGGDFNTYLDKKLDKHGGLYDDISNYANQLIEFNSEYNLIDIWRVLNPDVKRFTWRGHTRSGHVSSRLDYWLISTHLIYNIIDTDIHPSIKTDHSLISISFEIEHSVEPGRGFWKFNSDLLRDTIYVDKIKQLIHDLTWQYDAYENKSLLWDYIKCEIRGATISYASYIAKQRRQQEHSLTNRLHLLEELIDKGESVRDEYDSVKHELENINESKARGHLIRSKAKWIEDGEKCTKYFLQLETRNFKTKYIKTLNTEKRTIRDQKEILQEQEQFYSQLYKATHDNTNCSNSNPCSLFSNKANTLTDVEKQACDMNITIAECSKSLAELNNNKSPGSDGFTTEFYKFFWPDIQQHVFNSFQYSFQSGMLSNNQREAILSLLPKPNKDLRLLKNWRPISLLNTDYKILTKLLANRLQNVISSIVSEDQSGYIKNRYIGENIRLVLDVIEYSNITNNPGILLFLDFEKAFDTVSWDFLFKTLDYFNFGDYFKTWISILYNQPIATVLNNGHSTNFFPISRGIRQGCPISALLFILTVEVLTINIKANKDIKGITINKQEIFASQLADDTTLFINDVTSLEHILSYLEHFHKCAGLKINKDKTEAFILGKHNPNIAEYGIRTPDIVKYLGIFINKSLTNIEHLNYKEKISQIKNKLNMWKSRKLSIKGKITVLRSQILPIILYPSSVLYTPDDVLNEVSSLFFDFVWPNKKHHVKKKVLFQNIENGGLKMPDIFSMVKSLKLMWIKRFLTRETNYIHVAKQNSKILDFHKYFTHNMSRLYLETQPTPFYSQILDYWEEIRELSLSKMNINDILNEKLCFNKHIIVGNKPLTSYKFSTNDITKICDILKPNLSFKQHEELRTLTVMEYNQIISAIPKEWKAIISMNKNKNIQIEYQSRDDLEIRIGLNYKHILGVRCKDFYWHFINKIYETPTAVMKWEELYYFVDFDWKNIFVLPYKSTSETSLQSMQYQIINRYFPCKSFIGLWNTEIDTKCTLCNDEETLEHYFYHCDIVKQFWSKFFDWWHRASDCRFNLRAIDIIFGLMNELHDRLIDVLNYCIILAKKFILDCRTKDELCNFNVFQSKLKSRLLVEEYIATINGRLPAFIQKWNFIVNIDA